MKTYLTLILALMFSWALEAQQSPDVTFDRASFSKEVDAGNMSVLEQARALAPEDADRILRGVIDDTKLEYPWKAEAAAALLSELPGIPELYDQRLASMPHLHENTRERGFWMSVIEKFHKRWALNLLARYLFDDRPLGTKYTPAEFDLFSKEDGFRSNPNSSMAASSIADMCRKENLPTQEKPLFFTHEDVELMRQWWRKNEHQPDSFFFVEKEHMFSPQTTNRSALPSPAALHSRESPAAIPTTASTASTPWSFIVVLIMAASGLLWLLLKNRKQSAR